MQLKQISTWKAISVFGSALAYFYLLLFTLLPFLKQNFVLNPALYWFVTGYALFIPLFVYAIIGVKKEGARGFPEILEKLYIRSFTLKDWKYATIGLLLVFILTGAIFGISSFLTAQFGIRPLSTTPWFMEMHPFKGKDQLLLFIWLPMFFFNIAGEEILWRGYIQARLKGKFSWLLCSCLWLLFHLPFGIDLMFLLVPIIIIVPFFFDKTNNALVGIFIHGIYNGPMFVAVALGLIG